MLRGKKQVLAREYQVFLVRPIFDCNHKSQTSIPTLTCTFYIWSRARFPIIHHPCILIPTETSTPFYLILFPTYLHSWNALTSGAPSQQPYPQILNFSQYNSLKLCTLAKSCSSLNDTFFPAALNLLILVPLSSL